MGVFSFFSKEKKEKLDQGLEKTKESLFSKIGKALIGKSENGRFVLNDSLAVVNYVLDGYAMAYEDYPWKEHIQLFTDQNKMIIDLDESSIEVRWDNNANKLKYTLLKGDNVIDKR